VGFPATPRDGTLSAARKETCMPDPMPAISLVAVPGRRAATVELAQEIERRGFAGIYVPSMFGNLALCHALSWNTQHIPFGTAIAPIYASTIGEFAQSAAFLHETSGGRFRFGIGVSHHPAHVRMGVTPGKPLADTRDFITRLRDQQGLGAALRAKMVALAGELGQGVVFANTALAHMRNALDALGPARRDDANFLIAAMIPMCISDDIAAALAVNRRTLTSYAFLPNYRNYWKEAGYMEEMLAIEQAIATDRTGEVPALLTDRFLADTTLFGTATKVRDRLGAWRDAGVSTPIVVPSSAAGNQMKAIDEAMAAFAD
jgi:alkanesulfonate monooxygenase SsuD/methylene tetrahydromethanopterin reductase-like flavin-dependent oxidoreductase (luciferase family)